jgi:dihydrofolate reductase
MRRVVLQMGVSLDGFVAGPDGSLDWGLSPEHEDVAAWKVESVRQAGAHIMGGVTYEAMAAHWPSATAAYVAPMNRPSTAR